MERAARLGRVYFDRVSPTPSSGQFYTLIQVEFKIYC